MRRLFAAMLLVLAFAAAAPASAQDAPLACTVDSSHVASLQVTAGSTANVVLDGTNPVFKSYCGKSGDINLSIEGAFNPYPFAVANAVMTLADGSTFWYQGKKIYFTPGPGVTGPVHLSRASATGVLNGVSQTTTVEIWDNNAIIEYYDVTVNVVAATPTVTSVLPISGPEAGGSIVTITGTNLSGATAVSFGGTAATGFTVNSATQITATAPAGTGAVDVRVTTPGGTSAIVAGDQFTYVAAPTVSGVAPNTGPGAGGTGVTITGANLLGATAVSFGGTPATGFTVNGATQITATAPPGSGTVDVRVVTVGGTSAISAADQYTYVPAPAIGSVSPNAGPTGGGTVVTVAGAGLLNATAVSFGGTPATGFSVDSATQLTATAPAGSGTVHVRVTTLGGTSATSGADQFSYVAAPAVTGIAPSTGSTSGGTSVTITGTDLLNATAVSFGGTAATGFTVDSATQISATAPAGSGMVDVRVTTAGGISAISGADQFTYVAPPAAPVIAAPAAGAHIAGNTPTYSGTSDAGVTVTVYVDGGSIGTTTASGGGGWSLVQPLQLADGSHSVYATATLSGVTGSASGTTSFTVDTTPPAAPVVTAPANGSTIGDSTPAVTGTAEPGSIVTVSIDSATAGTATADGSGNWTYQAGSLADGVHSVSATAADAVGNTGPASAVNSFTVDTTAPAAPVITAPTSGTQTLVTQPLISGTAEANATVTVSIDGSTNGTATANVGGAWTYTPASVLAAGAHTVSATASDGVGNASGSSATVSFEVVAVLATTQAVASINASAGVALPAVTPVTASGGRGALAYALSGGTLPAGISFDTATGQLSGTATAALAATVFTVTVTDQLSPTPQTSAKTFTFTVSKQAQTISFANPGTQPMSASPLTLAATADSGLTVSFSSATTSVCTVSGVSLTLVSPGTCTVNADQAGDAIFTAATTVTRSFSVTATALVVTQAQASVTETIGTAVNVTPVTAAGGFGTLSYALAGGVLPAGMSFNAATGALSGTPTAALAATLFTVTVTDQNTPTPQSGAKTFTLTIDKKPQTISFSSSAPGSAQIGGPGYTPAATATSGLAVAITIDASSSAVCTISGGVVSFIGNGTCTIDADQPGDATWAAATQQQQAIGVSALGAASSAVSFAPGALASGATGTMTITITNPNASAMPASAPLLSWDAAVLTRIVGAPGGTCTGVTGSVPTLGSVQFSNVTVPANASCTITLGFTGATAGATSFGLSAFTPAGWPATGAATSSAVSVKPVVTALSVTQGPVTGGTAVTVTGKGFDTVLANNAVKFGSATASISAATATTLTVTAPAGSAGAVDVVVTTNGMDSATSAADQFSYIGAPVAADLNGVAVVYDSTGTPIDLSGSITGSHSSIAIGTAPAHGTTSIAGDVVTYTPAAGYFGADSFTFTATGIGGTSAPATVTLSVGTPAAPVAADKSGVAVAYESAGTAIDLSASVTGIHSSIAIGTAPAHGTTSVAGDVVTYTPASGYYGADSFTYTATGPGGTSAAATVTLAVATPAAPVAAAKSGVSVGYDTAAAVDLSGSITGVHSSIAVASAPAHGTTSVSGDIVTYTPTAGYYGADSFTYTATGPGGTSPAAAVSLTVATPGAPVAADKSGVSVAYGTATAIDLSASVSGVHSSIAVASAPAHGTTSVSGDIVTYTPTAGYYGADSFTYAATGPGGTSAPATVTLAVATPPAPTVAGKTGVSVGYDTATPIDLSGSITGTHSSIAIATAPAHGTTSVSGDIVTYTPTAGYYGVDSFTYTATGPGGTSAAASVALTVATPPAPAAADKSGVAAGYNSATAIDLSGSVTGVHSGIAIATAPAHGTATIDGYVVTYTPASGYYGADSFTYTATGPGGTSPAATVRIAVDTPPPPATTPTSTTLPGSTTASGASTDIDLSSHITGVFTSVEIASQPAHGKVAIAMHAAARTGQQSQTLAPAAVAGSVIATYTPNPGYEGTDSFTFVAIGPGGASQPGTVGLTITATVPVAQDKTAKAGDGQTVSVELTEGATAGPFTGATIVSVTPADAATAKIVEGGTADARSYRLDVTTSAHFGGDVVVAYTLANVFGTSQPATVTVAVTARPDPSQDPDVRAISDAQAEATRRFARAQTENFMRRTEQLHHVGEGMRKPDFGVQFNFRDAQRTVTARDHTGLDDTLAIVGQMRGYDMPEVADGFGGRSAFGRRAAVAASKAPRGDAPPHSAAGDDGEPGPLGGIGLWVGGQIEIGTLDRTTRRTRITASTGGLSGGADIRLAPGVVVGVGAGYGSDLSVIGSAARVRSLSTIYAAYGSFAPVDGMFIDAVIAHGDLDFRTRRFVAAANATALGVRDGGMTFGSLSAGIDQGGDALRWSAYGRAEWLDADLDAYVERGAGRYDLRFDRRDVKSLTGVLGGRIEFTQPTVFGSVSPRVRAEWLHEFEDGGTQGLDYADYIGATTYGITTERWGREQYQVSLGSRFVLPYRWSFDFEFGLRGAAGERAGSVKAQITKEF